MAANVTRRKKGTFRTSHLIIICSTVFNYLFTFGEPGLVVNIRRDESELMSVRQHAQQQNYSATSTLTNPVIHNLTRER